MDIPTKAIIDVLTYLLPGFVTAALVYSLTSSQKSIPFERVVQALIFTIVVQAAVYLVKLTLLTIGSEARAIGMWTEDVRLIWSLVIAIGLGLFFAWATNTDRIHRLLRRVGITHQTSFASEWFGALSQNRGFIVLHLTGQRRLYGWAEEWPSTPGKGHFVIAQAEWLDGDQRVDLAAVNRVLVRAEDVEMLELMKPMTIEVENGRSESTITAAIAAYPPARR